MKGFGFVEAEDSEGGVLAAFWLGEDEGGFGDDRGSAKKDDGTMADSWGVGVSSDDDLKILVGWSAEESRSNGAFCWR